MISDYTNWVRRASLYVQGSLLIRLAEQNRTAITEEYVRTSMIDGLKRSKPNEERFVQPEVGTPWADSACLIDPKCKPARGRRPSHDIGVLDEHGNLKSAIEVKWLKQERSNEVIKDLIKLAMTKGTVKPERDSIRTYLLVGGESQSFTRTIQSIQATGLYLRWASTGVGNGLPKPVTLPLGRKIRMEDSVRSAWRKAVGWGGRTNQHLRDPGKTWDQIRCITRSSWFETWRTGKKEENTSLYMVLWELKHEDKCGRGIIDWNQVAAL